IAVGLALITALLLPLNLLTTQRFHHDEALYATWALEISSGQNPWLTSVPIDKPPLFLYTIALAMYFLGVTETAARAPSFVATAVTILLTFYLGQMLYSRRAGLLAAWLVALSPFSILFTPTALTDPLLVMLVMAACLLAVRLQSGWAGLFIGLAIATKQQGVFFIPLPTMLLILSVWRIDSRNLPSFVSAFPFRPVVHFFSIGILISVITFVWDSQRQQLPGFWQMSLLNYGGISSQTANFTERWWGFIDLLTYGTASPILHWIFIVGLPLLLIHGGVNLYHQRKDRLSKTSISNTQFVGATALAIDLVITVYALIFLFGHSLLSFQIWDRYLLGLIPFLALLLARILWLPEELLRIFLQKKASEILHFTRAIFGVGLIILLLATLRGPVQDAVNGRYPLGSNSGALQGIEQVTAYLQGNVGANHTLYHRWLGTHWRFYLWDYPYDLQHWSSPEDLALQAESGHLIIFPTWHSETEVRLVLAEQGLILQEVMRAYGSKGYPTIILYQIDLE
ncbi:MAG: glycosyltransferase family 39 protein, partial [Chloroflexota bacterium]